MQKQTPYQRVLLKLSGEILKGSEGFGINAKACKQLALTLKTLQLSEMQIGIVIGGGNIFRGIAAKELGIEKTPADHMGMLATIMNGIALQQSLEAIGCKARVMSALDCPKVVDSYNWQKARECLHDGEIVIFVGGTGNPFFTTDTAAAMRACETRAEILLKATKVDAVYNKDPLKFSDAKKYHVLTYAQVLAEKLEVMDATSIALCMNNKIPILVFHMEHLVPEKIEAILSRKHGGTLIESGG